MRKILSSIAAASLAAVSLVGLTPAANAATTMCEPNTTWLTWSGISSPWTITHASRYENNLTTSVTWTRTATFQKQLSASLTVTSGAGVSADIGVASLDAKVSYELAVAGSRTTTSSISVKGSLPSGHVGIWYAGYRQTTGSWSRMRCSSTGQSTSRIGYGTAKSFSVYTDGAVDCAVTPSSSSLGYVVKGQYC